MKKKIASLVLVFVFVFSTLTLAQASWRAGDDGVQETYEVCYLLQLSEIVLSISNQGDDVRQFDDEDDISARMWHLADLFIEARKIQNDMRGTMDECTSVISGFSEPCDIYDTFAIGFIHEEHMDLADFIAYFVGIPYDIEPMLWGRLSISSTFGQPVFPSGVVYESNDTIYESLEGRSVPRILPVGTRLMFRHPTSQALLDMGSLGHPTSASGRTAMVSNHNIVPTGARVYTRDRGEFIGVVWTSGGYDPLNGLDIGSLRLQGDFFVDTRAYGGGSITTFFTSRMSAVPITLIGASGRRTAHTHRIGEVEVRNHQGIIVRWNHMIITTGVPMTNNDSGGAAVQDNGRFPIGTITAGASGTTASSQAVRYQHIWWVLNPPN